MGTLCGKKDPELENEKTGRGTISAYDNGRVKDDEEVAG